MKVSKRQDAIINIINSKEIETQEQLRTELNNLGFNVTQATVSRDIKKLKLQEDEVSSVEWFSKIEIENLMKQDKFFKNHYEEFEILLKWLNNK